MQALIVVDMQNDFMPGGTLPVPHGNELVDVINRLLNHFEVAVATQDWHPKNHHSFVTQHPGRRVGDLIELNGRPQVLWPPHCMQDTPGAAFVPGLQKEFFRAVFKKGVDVNIDSYSGFFDNDKRRDTGLLSYLRSNNIQQLYIAGVATDYCVKYTALDAASHGFTTHVIVDACRGIGLEEEDIENALHEMQAAGVKLVNSQAILQPSPERPAAPM